MIFRRHPEVLKEKRFLRAIALRAGLGVLLLALACGGYAGYLQVSGNFHTVLSGVLYRAAQPLPGQIAAYQKEFGIRTIVNLRGENAGSPWYDNEVEESKELGITQIDFRMSARREMTMEQAEELISVLRNADKPILVHCSRGADRTGLASALFLAAVAKEGEAAAEAQISFHYGHISLPFLSPAYAMDRTFEKLEPRLGFAGS